MKQTQRPPANRRYEVIRLLQDNLVILRGVFEDTRHAALLDVIDQQSRLLRKLQADEWWFQEEEMAEALAMLNQLPYAVQTWLMDYKDKEMQ